jgi:anti-anti-sigma factor
VPLALQSRHVGPITVVDCTGRIVEGPESHALHEHLSELLPHQPHIILNLEHVDFVDSSGLGLLVRSLSRTRQAGGGLKLCAVPPRVAEVLRVTRLSTTFDVQASADEAILAFCQRSETDAIADRWRADVLCAAQSADVLAFLREVLKHAGYGVVSSSNWPDALILLKAMRPKALVIGADLRSSSTTSVAESVSRLAHPCVVVELPPDFAGREAGDAGQHVLGQVRAAVGAITTS